MRGLSMPSKKDDISVGEDSMIQSSKMGLMGSVIIFVLIFIVGMAGLLAQTIHDDGIDKDKLSRDTAKEKGLFGTSISIGDLGGIGGFVGGITTLVVAIVAGIRFLIRRGKSVPQIPLIQIVESSVYIDNLLKDKRSQEFSRVEKIVQNVEQSSKIPFMEKTTADAYRLQQDGRIDEARQKWRAIADYAERKDDDLAKRAGVSIGYLLPEGEDSLASHSRHPNLRPSDHSEVYMYRNLGEHAGEGVVVGTVLRYFNDSKFEKFSTVQEHNVGSDSHRMVDVALLDRSGQLAAIAECKRIGYVGKEWLAQLTEYCRQGAVQLGLFAADTDPSKWTFLRILEDRIIEITRSQFEEELIKSGLS